VIAAIAADSAAGSTGFGRVRLESSREGPSAIVGARVACQGDRRQKTSMFGFMLPNPPAQRVPGCGSRRGQSR